MASDIERVTAQLRKHGERRAHALQAAETEMEAIAALIPEALAVRLTKSEIAEIAGLSRPTIYELLRRCRST